MKKLIYLATFIILACSVFATSAHLELSSDTFGLDQQIQGVLTLDTDSKVLLTDYVDFYVNSKKVSEKISDLILTGSTTKIAESIEKKGTPKTTARYSFSTEGNKVLYAIDLGSNGIDHKSIQDINSLSLKLSGEKVSEIFPHGVKIDIGNDGVYEYTYQGNLIPGEFEDLDSSYLADEPSGLQAEIKGSGTDVLCQPIQLLPSSNFTIKVQARKIKDFTGEQFLKVSLAENPEEMAKETCDESAKNCCKIAPQSHEDLKEYSCSVGTEINEERTMYACVFMPNGGATETYYKVGTDYNAGNSLGYLNGVRKADLNFYITMSRQKFNSELSTEVDAIIEGKDISYSEELIPIAIYSSSPGKVNLKNLDLSINFAGLNLGLTEFTEVDYTPESLEFNTPINISLGSFTDLIAPSYEGENYEIYSKFLTKESNIEKFNAVKGLSAGIQTSTLNPYLGEQITLAAAGTTTNTTTHSWKFGDNKTSSGKTTTHSYNEPGEYIVTLTTTDVNGIISTNTVTLTVASIRDSIEFLVSNTKAQAEATKAKITASKPEIKTALDLLGLETELNSLLNNLTTIKNEVNATLSNTVLNETKKDQALMITHAKLKSLMAKVVADFTISGSNFDSKIYSLDKIPTAIQLQIDPIDSFKEKVFMAQQSVQVDGAAYAILFEYASGDQESLVLVKKTITGGGEYYEVLPTSAAVQEILKPIGTTYTQTNIIKFSSSPLVYTLSGVTTDMALLSQTVVIPANLASISTGTIEEIASFCGDQMCDILTESSSSCPQDCSTSKPWWVLFPLLILLGGGIFYIFFYNGKGSFNEIFIKKKTLPPAVLFKSEKDRNVVKSYIKGALRKGFADIQIKFALKTKGWKEEQISAALNEVKAEKAKGN